MAFLPRQTTRKKGEINGFNTIFLKHEHEEIINGGGTIFTFCSIQSMHWKKQHGCVKSLKYFL